MNTKKLTRKIRIFGLAFALLFGIGILSATTANAQTRNNRDDNDRYEDRDDDDRYNDRDYENRDIIRQAYRNGYKIGLQMPATADAPMEIKPPVKQCAA